ncbi:hypothetical protein QQZ08_007463 [Neonectria magnoliae]|uniref:Xanthan lyase n=1 Tax=Neonectria magnoliae TaxID=2732573 RepID=A0ABR1HXK9_9HYPO
MAGHVDIVVYGSTSGAIATSIQAVRLGRSVILISPQEHIGVIQVNGLGATDIDNQAEFQNSATLGGLNLELHQRISKYYGRLDRLNEVIGWMNAMLFLSSRSPLAEDHSVMWEGNLTKSIRLADGDSVTGKLFVEASYEETSSLQRASLGREVAKHQVPTTSPWLGYDKALPTARSRWTLTLISVRETRPVGISDEPFGKSGDGDLHLQSYSYRLPLTDDRTNRIPFSKPDGYDPEHYELHRRCIRAGGEFYIPRKRTLSEKTDLIDSEGALSTDLLGMNDDWPIATQQGRKRILEDTARFANGLLWFISTDESVPGGVKHASG